jgi:iron-sulfur cluster protein
VLELAARYGARRVVKSKSMTTEEIRLNSALEAAGIAVRETDLGEYIVQLAGDRPSHVTAPIIHMSVNDVRRVFAERLGVKDVPQEPAELTQLARQRLRADFLAADLGITGANFLLADTGTVVIVENEGNVRLTTQIPATHVVLAGIEKLIPSGADLLPFLQLLPRTSTGQLLTAYLSFISTPGWAQSPLRAGTARELHVVLLDNGRYAMRNDALLREALYCIRCGACMTVCPPYQVVGGHVYGGPTYPSGIGNAWEAGVRGLDTAAEFNALCTTCSRCQDVCPVRIDIPWMNVAIRERIAERRRRPRGTFERLIHDRLFPTEEEGSVSLAARLFSDPRRAYALGRRKPWSTLMRLGPARRILARAAGLAGARRLPVPAEQTFTAWYRQHRGRVATKRAEAQRLCSDRRPSTVFLFADCHTEHIDTAVGKATIGALEKSGLAVVLVSGLCCGRAALSQGMLRTARAQAKALQDTLAPAVETGHRIVGIEPSCLAAVADDHAKLLPGKASNEVAKACRDVLQVLHERALECAASGRPLRWKKEGEAGSPTRAVLHGHCQQKTLGWMPAAAALLREVPGLELQVTTAECCGMAGSFGYKSDFYPLSAELGRRLIAEVDQLEAAGGGPEKAAEEGCRILACGTSCRSQIADLGGRRACHPVQLIYERLVKR